VERALERQAEQPRPGYGQEEVIAAAREIGVDEDTLRAAARDLAARRASELSKLEKRDVARRKLLRHAATYAVVNLFLLMMVGWGATKFVLLGWGFALALQAVRFAFPDDEKEKKREQKARKKARVDEVRAEDPEIQKAVDELLSSTARRFEKLRVAAATPG